VKISVLLGSLVVKLYDGDRIEAMDSLILERDDGDRVGAVGFPGFRTG